VLWISPAVVVLVPGGGGATAPVVWISPARAKPESTHARAIANAKCLILSVSPFEVEDASPLARKQDSVNTYKTIDTGYRAMANIRTLAKHDSYHSQTKVNLREDGLT
jgi:hypothetical protein